MLPGRWIAAEARRVRSKKKPSEKIESGPRMDRGQGDGRVQGRAAEEEVGFCSEDSVESLKG